MSSTPAWRTCTFHRFGRSRAPEMSHQLRKITSNCLDLLFHWKLVNLRPNVFKESKTGWEIQAYISKPYSCLLGLIKVFFDFLPSTYLPAGYYLTCSCHAQDFMTSYLLLFLTETLLFAKEWIALNFPHFLFQTDFKTHNLMMNFCCPGLGTYHLFFHSYPWSTAL